MNIPIFFDFSTIEFPEWMKYQSPLVINEKPKDKLEQAVVDNYYWLRRRESYIHAPDLSPLSIDDKTKLLSSLDGISKRTAVDVANMTDKDYLFAKMAGDIDAVEAYELYKRGELIPGELTPNQNAVNDMLDMAWAYTGYDTPFKQYTRGVQTGNVFDIGFGSLGAIFSPFTIVDSSTKWLMKEIRGGAPTTDPDKALFGYTISDYFRDTASVGKGYDITSEIAKVPILGDAANILFDLAVSPTTYIAGLGLADDVVKGIQAVKRGYMLNVGADAFQTWQDANRLIQSWNRGSFFDTLIDVIKSIKNKAAPSELKKLSNIRFVDDLNNIFKLNRPAFNKFQYWIDKNFGKLDESTRILNTTKQYILNLGKNIEKITGIDARKLTTSIQDIFGDAITKITNGDQFAVTTKNGQLFSIERYSPELASNLDDLGNGFVTRIIEAERVGNNGVNVIYHDVTKKAVKQAAEGTGFTKIVDQTIDNLDGAYKQVDDLNDIDDIMPEAGITGVGGEYKATKDNLEKLWQFKDYIRDIELHTRRKLTNEQIKRLGEAIRSNIYIELSEAEKTLNRAAFDNKRIELILEWQKKTGQKWPKYKICIFDKNGKIVRSPNSFYDAHEIIPNSFGGPLEWWNIHPAKWPDEHQGGIHRASGILNRIISRKRS